MKIPQSKSYSTVKKNLLKFKTNMLALITSIKYGVESSKQKIRQEIKKTFKLERRSIMFADYMTLYGENHKNFRNTGENNC